MLKPLCDVINYTNLHVLNRYKNDYPNSKLTPQEAFEELMKYFWLGQNHKTELAKNPNQIDLQFTCAIQYEMKEIDDMWHTFLLFTKDYMSFCNTYFGEYIHHIPNTDDNPVDPIQFETDFTRYLKYIDTHLGEETLRKWFSALVDKE